jgi:hypothetical protein
MNQNVLETYKAAIIADYVEFQRSSLRAGIDPEFLDRMLKEFKESISFKVGKKYIKVIKDDSAHSFIVNTQDDSKFVYGDILKPAGYAVPARNFARGNVFGKYKISWTGAI